MSDERIKFALDLAKAGKKEEARAIFQDILKHDRDNAHAWAGMARVAESREQAVYCLEQVLRIKPGNEWAKNILQKLAPEKAANLPEKLAKEPTGVRKLWASFLKLSTSTRVIIIAGVILGSCCGLGMIRAFFFPSADKEPSPTVTLIAFVEEDAAQVIPTIGTPRPSHTPRPIVTLIPSRTQEPQPTTTDEPILFTNTPGPTPEFEENNTYLSSPAPLGAAVAVPNYIFVVNSLTRPADDIVTQANELNPGPEDGQEYVMIEITVTCRQSQCFFDPDSFDIVGNTGEAYDSFLVGAESELQSIELLQDTSVTGKLFFPIQQEEAALVLRWEPFLGDEAFFATSESQTPTDTPTPLPTDVPTNAPPPTEDTNPYPGCPKLTCDKFTRCEDVHEYLDYCPSYWDDLDGNNDGVPCQNVCK